MTDERRVRHLRLGARSEALVRRGALLLEDALRTASLPRTGPERVLYIRALELGVIHANRSPSALALAVERRVQALTRDAVHAEERGAASAAAVYFHDAVEALAAVGTRLARQEPMDGWFWPLVLTGVRERPRDEALRAVLEQAGKTELGAAGPAAVMDRLEAQGALGPLLGALRWQDGQALARAWWGHVPVVERGVLLARAPTPEVAVMSPRWRAQVTAWIETWGAEDTRSLWLAAVALCVERPGRAEEAQLPARAARVVAALAPGAEPRRPVAEPEPVVPRRAPTETREDPAVASPRAPDAVSAETAEPEARPVALADEVVAAQAKQVEGAQVAEAGGRAETPAVVTVVGPERVGEEPRLLAVDPWPRDPQPTTAGGLLFLVHALAHLGLPELLEANPALAELALPERLLGAVAARLGVPEEDPVVRALRVPGPWRGTAGGWRAEREGPGAERGDGPAQPTGPAGRYWLPFALPERMRIRMGIRASHWVELSDGRRVEVDARGRVPLASESKAGASGPAPASPASDSVLSTVKQAGVSGAGPEAPAASAPPWLASDDLTLLLRALQLALGKLLRTRAGMSLRTLVLRPARLVSTPTHLDLLFDHRLADLRVRRAGLDVDPGWVPWLGRVIRYHYLHGELPQH